MTRSSLGIRVFWMCVFAMPIAIAAAGEDPHRAFGDSRVVAQLPASPGYPEGIAVRGHTIYVSTGARFGDAGLVTPEVEAFDRGTGALVARYPIPAKEVGRDHGLSGLAFDADGMLYVLDTQWGIIAIDPRSGAQSVYATAFPDIPPCSAAGVRPCSPTFTDNPPLPNDLVFDEGGNAYVTDSFQATLWIVPRGGGAPRVFFQDARLDGPFGANGIRLDRDRDAFFINVSLDYTGHGSIYTLPRDLSAPLARFHDFGGAGPDDLALGKSGRLYVTLAFSSQIAILDPGGAEVARFSGPSRSRDGAVPWDMPSGVALDPATDSLLVNNHSEFAGIPSHFVVFDLYVDDRPAPLARPEIH